MDSLYLCEVARVSQLWSFQPDLLTNLICPVVVLGSLDLYHLVLIPSTVS